jgi:hypothetical protein
MIKTYYIQYDWFPEPGREVNSWVIVDTPYDLDTSKGFKAYWASLCDQVGTKDVLIRFWRELDRK